MAYFEKDDHRVLLALETGQADNEAGLQRIHNRMVDLHRSLYSRLKQHGLDIHPNPVAEAGIGQLSSASPFPTAAMVLTYMRNAADAKNIEHIVGLDPAATPDNQKIYLHPVIELRITPQHFVVEMVVAPEARHDQQNYVGKLSVRQHRLKFYELLSDLRANYLLGFWAGAHMDDVYLETSNLPPQRILFEYLDTFAAGRDYLRVGHWYQPGDERLTEGVLLEEVFQRVRELHTVYEFLLWTSDNNFQSFYKKSIARS